MDTSTGQDAQRGTAAMKIIESVNNLATDDGDTQEVLSAIEELLRVLVPGQPLYAAFHDGQVHDPLGAGAYAFREDLVGPLLRGLASDESDLPPALDEDAAQFAPTRPIIFHAGAQPNSSPHCGTLIVFCFAFAVAAAARDRMRAAGGESAPPVSVEITLVDTAPVNGKGIELDGIQYQRSYRDVPNALDTCMADYREVLGLLSTWSGIDLRITFQSDFFSSPHMPGLVNYLIANHQTLGRQLSPKYGKLALRAACPIPGCYLAEKHGRLNQYTYPTSPSSHPPSSSNIAAPDPSTEAASGDPSAPHSITFQCPHHGPHSLVTSSPASLAAGLEANAPTRSLLRSMTHLLDTEAHHVRITGADYAGTYQEALLLRPLAEWMASSSFSSPSSSSPSSPSSTSSYSPSSTSSSSTQRPESTEGEGGLTLKPGRTPHILYAPLVVDWSGAKLSKSLYVRQGGYDAMRLLGTDGLCSWARLKAQLREERGEEGGEAGLRRLWEEVRRWVADPRRLFRCWSVEYLQRVVIRGEGGAGSGVGA